MDCRGSFSILECVYNECPIKSCLNLKMSKNVKKTTKVKHYTSKKQSNKRKICKEVKL